MIYDRLFEKLLQRYNIFSTFASVYDKITEFGKFLLPNLAGYI